MPPETSLPKVTLAVFEIEEGARWKWKAAIDWLGFNPRFTGYAASLEDALQLGDSWIKWALAQVVNQTQKSAA